MKLGIFRLSVYGLDPGPASAFRGELPGLAIKAFEAADVARYFADDRNRGRTFRGFLDQGFKGVLVHDRAGWVGYGWLATPDTPGPPHLPPWLFTGKPNWLFYAHTRDGFRGKGVHKAMIGKRLEFAAEGQTWRESVYSDTDFHNLASRRALLSMGFQPRGAVTCLTLPLPISGRPVLGWWDPDAPHPALARPEQGVGL
jgi:GNAT superfamily N-acetyltransferase